jgi:magnesium chelatase subunit H
MPKPISAGNAIPVRVVIVTMDTHLASATERAARILRQEFPSLTVTLHAASEWSADPVALSRCRDDIARGDIVINAMLFMEDHFDAVLPDLAARRSSCDAMVSLLSASEVMKLTRAGRFTMDGSGGGALAFLKRLRGNGKDRNASAGAKQMKMLKRLPQILRFIPGTAQDVRVYFLALQYWLAGSDENIANMIRMLVDRYADGARRPLRGTLKPAAPVSYPEVGVYHPRMKGRIAEKSSALPAGGKRGTVGILGLRSYMLAGNAAHYDGVIEALEKRGLSVVPAFSSGLDSRPAIEQFFRRDGKTTVDALVSLTGFSLVGGPAYNDAAAAADVLSALDVPYVAAHPAELQTLEQWGSSDRGLLPVESTIMVAIPELDGATGPMVFGGRSDKAGKACTGCHRGCVFEAGIGDRDMQPCVERAEMLAARIDRLVTLRRTRQAERRIGVVLFNFPPNGGNTGTAAYLSVFESLMRTLTALKAEGYTVDLPASVDDLRERVINGNRERFGADANVHGAHSGRRPRAPRALAEGDRSSSGVRRRAGRRATVRQHLQMLGAQCFGNVAVGGAAGPSATKATRCACCSRRASRRRTRSRRSIAGCAKTSAPMRCCTSAPTARWSSCPGSRAGLSGD